MRIVRIIPFLLVTANTAVAQQSAADKPGTTVAVIAFPGELKWSPAPALLPAGARLAVIEGDPGKAAEFTMRLWMPANYRIPPHFHPATEHVTVVQGTFFVGMGETFDIKRGQRLAVGSFGALPAGMRHFAWTEGETVIQLHGVGPWSLSYVNPSDDPTRKSK
jgi:quercetin dioxygenase-like cupin family protein